MALPERLPSLNRSSCRFAAESWPIRYRRSANLLNVSMAPANPSDHLIQATADVSAVAEFIRGKRRLFVLTGAGCSTASGIPDYRDEQGDWKHKQPINLQSFLGSAATRRRYWARSRVGWQRIRDARPNPAHRALADLERSGRLSCLVTQNVDSLHRRAGSVSVVDLHGRLDEVECMACRSRFPRNQFQQELVANNPGFEATASRVAPDGDVDLGDFNYDQFVVPACQRCGGVLKPAVVFFGESVPAHRVEYAYNQVHQSDGVLIVGSSLMVFSGYRFARAAAKSKIPIAIVNQGRTRADDLATLRAHANCSALLPEVVRRLTAAIETAPIETAQD